MFDVALIQQCADPGIEIATVERFIAAAGSDNPLAISITSGNRTILPEAPQTVDQAMTLLQRFVGKAIVRVGVTLYPAGNGVSDVAQLNSDLLDPCENIRMGTALFGKIYRVVAHSHGTSGEAVFSEAIEAWQTGTFGGTYVFGEPDPGPLPVQRTTGEETAAQVDASVLDAPQATPADGNQGPPLSTEDPYKAGMRVDLTGIAEGAQ